MQEVNGFNVARINGAQAIMCRCVHLCSRRNKLPHGTVTASCLNLLSRTVVKSYCLAFIVQTGKNATFACVCEELSVWKKSSVNVWERLLGKIFFQILHQWNTVGVQYHTFSIEMSHQNKKGIFSYFCNLLFAFIFLGVRVKFNMSHVSI